MKDKEKEKNNNNYPCDYWTCGPNYDWLINNRCGEYTGSLKETKNEADNSNALLR